MRRGRTLLFLFLTTSIVIAVLPGLALLLLFLYRPDPLVVGLFFARGLLILLPLLIIGICAAVAAVPLALPDDALAALCAIAAGLLNTLWLVSVILTLTHVRW